MNGVLKKIVLSLLVLAIIVPGFALPRGQARAVLGIGDITLLDIQSLITDTIVPFLKNIVFQSFKNRVIAYYYNATLSMIAGATSTDPQVISSYYKGLLGKASDAAIGDVIGQLGDTSNLNLCQPQNWGFNLQISVVKPQPLPNQVSCTLTSVLGNIEGGIDSFVNNFTTGGWLAFTESLDPQNNPWGVAFAARSALFDAQAAETSQAENDAQSGSGFMSMKECHEWTRVGNNTVSLTEDTSVSTDIGATVTGAAYRKISPDGHTYNGKSAKPEGSDWQCTDPWTVTPGSIIAGQATKVTGSPAERIANAKDFSELFGGVLDGLANAVVTRAMTEVEKSALDAFQKANAADNCDSFSSSEAVIYGLCKIDKLFKKVENSIADGFKWLLGNKQKKIVDSAQTAAQSASSNNIVGAASASEVDAQVQTAEDSLDIYNRSTLTAMLSSDNTYITVENTGDLPVSIVAAPSTDFSAGTALAAASELITLASSSNANLITYLVGPDGKINKSSPDGIIDALVNSSDQEGVLNTALTTTASAIQTASTTHAAYLELLDVTYPARISANPLNFTALQTQISGFLTNINDHLIGVVNRYRTSCALERQACTDLHNVATTAGRDCDISKFICGGSY